MVACHVHNGDHQEGEEHAHGHVGHRVEYAAVGRDVARLGVEYAGGAEGGCRPSGAHGGARHLCHGGHDQRKREEDQ